MSVFPKGLQLMEANYGLIVTGGPKTLPATGSGDIFTVTGGRVLVTSLVGQVSTAIQNQACTLSVGYNPASSPETTALCTATSIANLAVGVMVALPAAITSALVVAANAGVLAAPGKTISSSGIAVVAAGTIDVTTSATNTGAIIWTVTYIPYDTGASVTAL